MHRHTAGPRASTKFLHHSARSLRRTISLLSMFPAVAGVQPETSRSIKPRERDLGDLRLFFLVRILTRPTNHPRHAACASNNESKPVRPHFNGDKLYPHWTLDAMPCCGIARARANPKLRATLEIPNPKPASVRRARGGEFQTPSNHQNPNLQKRSSGAAGASEKIACRVLPPATRLALCRS